MTMILEIGLNTELCLTPLAAIIIDELVRKENQDTISILFLYIIKPSNKVLPIVLRWFTDYDNNQIKKLADLLLVKAKHIFEPAIDTIIDYLESDNDQMRYRAQQIFQHPEQNSKEPSKRISVIGEKTLMKILQSMLTYMNSFFFELPWNDPEVFQNLHEPITKLKESNSAGEQKIFYFNKIKFINNNTCNSIMQSLESPSYSSYVEELFHSIMILTQHNQITKTQLDRIYIINFILDKFCALTNINDETYFEILESKVINRYNFYVSTDLNQTILNMLNNISINIVIMKNLIKCLIQQMTNLKGVDGTVFSLMMCAGLLSLVSACVQKEDYLYRKITNSPNFNKVQMIKLLEKMLDNHPYFPERGNAFILLSAMDQSDHKVIINVINTLLDENLVKEYSVIGIPLINLSPNELIDDLLKSLKNDSAIKADEILKILTQFALNEKINADRTSKIINYPAEEIEQLKSKKPVNYYYTDIKIPFTTSLENEFIYSVD
ncbi:unnamed protein product [Rotaria sp. Silwood2]|nr:unnamed protein product [Rotaria sp. Silwood2]